MSGVNESAQRELPMFEVKAEDESVRWLESYLKEAGDWMTARALLELVPCEERDERWLRVLAAASDWVISGQKGYKHLSQATAEEVQRFVHWMESQGKKMVERAERVRRNAHKALG